MHRTILHKTGLLLLSLAIGTKDLRDVEATSSV